VRLQRVPECHSKLLDGLDTNEIYRVPKIEAVEQHHERFADDVRRSCGSATSLDYSPSIG
jgi:hypothetical protein